MKLILKNFLLLCLVQFTAFCIVFIFETVKLYGSWIEYGAYRENSQQVGEFTLLKYSTDGKYIFTFCKDSLIRKWDNVTGEILSEIKFEFHENGSNKNDKYFLADISPDGKYILIWHWRQNIYDIIAEVLMYDLETNLVKFKVYPPFKTIMQPYGTSGPPVYVFGASVNAKFSFDGSIFFTNVNLNLEYSSYIDNGIQNLWNSSDGSSINKNYTGRLIFHDISKDSKNFAHYFSVTYDMNLHLPDFINLKLNDSSIYTDNYIQDLSFTNDNRNLAWIAVENTNKFLFQWDIVKNELLNKSLFERSDERSVNMLFTTDDRFFVCEKESGLAFYQYPSAVKAFEMNFDFIEKNSLIKMNPEKNEIAIACKDGILRIIKPDKAEKELTSVFRADTTIVIKGTTLGFTDYSYGEPDGWNWDFGDGIKSTEKNPEHTYNQVGTYTVSLIAAKGTLTDTSIKLNYISVIEPSEVFGETAIYENYSIVSPNPASNYIEFLVKLPEKTEVIIYSVIGNQIYRGKATGRIDLSGCMPGVYFMAIKTGNHNETEKFVIIR